MNMLTEQNRIMEVLFFFLFLVSRQQIQKHDTPGWCDWQRELHIQLHCGWRRCFDGRHWINFSWAQSGGFPDGGSIYKNTSKYHTKGDVENCEEHVKGGKEEALALFKAIEAYVLAHPDAY